MASIARISPAIGWAALAAPAFALAFIAVTTLDLLAHGSNLVLVQLSDALFNSLPVVWLVQAALIIVFACLILWKGVVPAEERVVWLMLVIFLPFLGMPILCVINRRRTAPSSMAAGESLS